MILLCGIPSEPSLAIVVEQLNKLGVHHLVFNQRNFASMKITFKISHGCVTGWMQYEGMNYRVEHFTSVYTRLMDYRFLPELKNERPNSPMELHCRTLHETLVHWLEIAPGRIVNRPSPMGSNYSKPFPCASAEQFPGDISSLVEITQQFFLDYINREGDPYSNCSPKSSFRIKFGNLLLITEI